MKRQEIVKLIKSTTMLEAGIIEVVRKAAKDLHTVIITYQDSQGQLTDREVEPYEIKDGKLWAFCMEKGSIRQFTLGHIFNITISNHSYRPRWPVKIF